MTEQIITDSERKYVPKTGLIVLKGGYYFDQVYAETPELAIEMAQEKHLNSKYPDASLLTPQQDVEVRKFYAADFSTIPSPKSEIRWTFPQKRKK